MRKKLSKSILVELPRAGKDSNRLTRAHAMARKGMSNVQLATVGTVTNRKVIRNSVPDFRNIKHAWK